MPNSNAMWTKWAEILASYKAKNFVAWLLEAGEPLTLVGAQLLYFGQPLLGHKRVENLAQLLENKDETRAFVIFLKEP